MDLQVSCEGCGSILVRQASGRLSRRYCSDRCKMRFHRQQARRQEAPVASAIMPWDQPVLYHGRFEDYAEAYLGQIDVILTDPPYDRKALPVYQALATFADTVLVPGGWLLCMTGKGIVFDVFPRLSIPGLEYLTAIDYRMTSSRSKAQKWTTTGKRFWQERHKPVLWFQKRALRRPGARGTHPAHRRAGGSDFVDADVQGGMDLDQVQYPDQQSLMGFQALVSKYTNPQDVILDPCMGWGTTVLAALSMHRPRVIGIEKDRRRYAYAAQQLGARRGEEGRL